MIQAQLDTQMLKKKEPQPTFVPYANIHSKRSTGIYVKPTTTTLSREKGKKKNICGPDKYFFNIIHKARCFKEIGYSKLKTSRLQKI